MLSTEEVGNRKPEVGSRKAKDNQYHIALLTAFCLLLFAFCFSGCRQDMHDQPKFKPLRPSEFFADGRGSRPLPDGTVARGQLKDDAQFYTGKTEQGAQAVAAQGGTASQGVADSPSQNASI